MYWLGICFPAGVRTETHPYGHMSGPQMVRGERTGLSLTAPQTALELPRPVLVNGAAVTVLARAPVVHVPFSRSNVLGGQPPGNSCVWILSALGPKLMWEHVAAIAGELVGSGGRG